MKGTWDGCLDKWIGIAKIECSNCQYYVDIRKTKDFPYCSKREIITEGGSICSSFQPIVQLNPECDNPSRRKQLAK